MDHQACQDPRDSQGKEEKKACLGSLGHRVKLGSRAWQASVETREKPASQVIQGSQV